MKHECVGDTSCIGALGTIHKGLVKGIENLEIIGLVEIIETTSL